MGFVIVLAVAVAVGVMVYRLTGGGAPPADPVDALEWAGGEVGDRGAVTSGSRAVVAPDRIQVTPDMDIPVVTANRSWHSRLVGALGLIVAIGVGAIAIAFTLYSLGSLIARLVDTSNLQ